MRSVLAGIAALSMLALLGWAYIWDTGQEREAKLIDYRNDLAVVGFATTPHWDNEVTSLGKVESVLEAEALVDGCKVEFERREYEFAFAYFNDHKIQKFRVDEIEGDEVTIDGLFPNPATAKDKIVQYLREKRPDCLIAR